MRLIRISAALLLSVIALSLFGASSGNIQWTQLRSTDRHGNGTIGQSFTGSSTNGHVAVFDSNGNVIDGGTLGVGFATGSSHTFSGSYDIFVCTTTCTITVPVPSGGVQYCVLNDDNVSTVITLAGIGSSAMYENQARTAYGTAGTGTLVSGGAAKDLVCILGRDSTHYLFASGIGTWTVS